MNDKLLYTLFSCTESFELPDKIMNMYENKPEIFKEVINVLIENHETLEVDTLIDYFQEKHGDRKVFKQDYTPTQISKLMHDLIFKDDGDVLDFCSGTGSLAIPWMVDGKERKIVFEESSKRALAFLLINAALRKTTGKIYCKDVLTNEVFKTIDFSNGLIEDDKKFDVIVSNPPFSLKWNQEVLVEGIKPPPKSKADYAFIFKALERLKDNGTMAMILPHGVLFRGKSEEACRRYLLESNLIDAIIGLPSSMFKHTKIPTCIVIFKKNRENKDILFIDASKDFIKKGKYNTLTDEQIDRIVSTYKDRVDIPMYSHIATNEEILNNEFNLNIPRYVDTYVEEEVRDLEDIVDELLSIKSEILEYEAGLMNLLEDLVGTSPEGARKLEKVKEKTRMLFNT